MTEEKFHQLVERLSLRAKQHPVLYRFEVLGLAAIGYLYILLLVLGAVVFSIGLVVVSVIKPILLLKLLKIIWLPVWFVWTVLKAMWVRFEPPTGRELTRDEAPVLFSEIDSIRAAIDGPHPHHVLVTDEFNAAVTQRPRLGPLGWPRNYLILGLPMMSALSPEQFRAVIAHEFGHLGGGDSRMTGRIYHMHITWGRLQSQFEQRGGILFKRFFAWFGPHFNAYSFVLARAQEYAADAASARLVGATRAAEALVLAQLGDDFQSQRVWTPVWARIPEEELPAALPYSQMLLHGRSFGDWSEAGSRLERSMRRRTDWSDTHPALNDRLAALGQEARLPPAQGPSAASVFLGAAAETLARELDEQWRTRVAGPWAERHREKQAERTELAALEASVTESGESLDRERAWRRAVLAESVRDGAAALPLYREHTIRFPDDAGARFACGRILLEQGDETGIGLIGEVMRDDARAIKPGAENIIRFLLARDREPEAQPYRKAWRERDELEASDKAERGEFGPGDDYEAHGLDEQAVAKLRAALSGLNWVAQVWLVRKTLKIFPEKPAYLLLVKPRWYKSIKPEKARQEIHAALGIEDLTIAIHSKDLKPLFKRASAVIGCELHRA